MPKRISDPFKFDRAFLAEHGWRRDVAAPLARGPASGGPPDLSEPRDLAEPSDAAEPPEFAGCLAGADEAGRGCLAGPLVAAAVVLDYNCFPFKALKGLTDSKMMTREARERMYEKILLSSVRLSVAVASPHTIDQVGLHSCNLELLCRCLETVSMGYELAIVDAFDLKRPDLRARGMVGADYKSAAVAAASVVAKVTRDRLMRRMASSYPEYGFDDHVGYATETHKRALRLHGPSRFHRFSFQGVANPQLDNWEEAAAAPSEGPDRKGS